LFKRRGEVKRYVGSEPYWKEAHRLPAESIFWKPIHTLSPSPESLKERGQENSYGDIRILAKDWRKHTFCLPMGSKGNSRFRAQFTGNGGLVDGPGWNYDPGFRIDRYDL